MSPPPITYLQQLIFIYQQFKVFYSMVKGLRGLGESLIHCTPHLWQLSALMGHIMKLHNVHRDPHAMSLFSIFTEPLVASIGHNINIKGSCTNHEISLYADDMLLCISLE